MLACKCCFEISLEGGIAIVGPTMLNMKRSVLQIDAAEDCSAELICTLFHQHELSLA